MKNTQSHPKDPPNRPILLAITLLLLTASTTPRHSRRQRRSRYDSYNSEETTGERSYDHYSHQNPKKHSYQNTQESTLNNPKNSHRDQDSDLYDQPGHKNNQYASKNRQKFDRNPDYNYYVLALAWPGGVCHHRSCPFDTNHGEHFNLHGLWPSSTSRRMGPHDCDTGSEFRIKWRRLPAQLTSDLKEYWAGLFADRERFNEHEWFKHGTCLNPFSANLANLPSTEIASVVKEYRRLVDADGRFFVAYFELAIALSRHYDLKAVLGGAGVEPRYEAYRLWDVKNAIKDEYGVDNFTIKCKRGGRVGFLEEVRLCLDLDFRVVDCVKRFSTNCRDDVVYNY